MNLTETLRSYGYRSLQRFQEGGVPGLTHFVRIGLERRIYDFGVHPLLMTVASDRFLSNPELTEYAATSGRLVQTGLDDSISLADGTMSKLRLRETSERPGDAIDLVLTDEHGTRHSPVPPYFTETDTRIRECPEARLAGPVPVGFTADHRLILDTVFHTRQHSPRLRWTLRRAFEDGGLRELRSMFSPPERAADTSLERAALLTSLWGDNFGHWMSEELLKLRYLEQYERQTGAFPTLVVKRNPPDWKVEYLEELGYGDRYVEWDGGPIDVQTLVVPPFPHPTPGALQWLRSRIPDVESHDSTIDRVYISRQSDKKNRRVANWGAVSDLLAEYGFESYALEELSVRDQANLFRTADIVAGVHGAGFSNTMFADRPTLIEILDGHVHPGSAWAYISAIFGWEHHYLWGSAQDDGIHVELDRLEKAICEAV